MTGITRCMPEMEYCAEMDTRPQWPTFAPDDDPMAVLIGMSRHYGGNPAFVLAGGGNTSYKTASRLYVKASGHALETIDADGFVEMDREALDSLLAEDLGSDLDRREEEYKRRVLDARVDPDRGQRPSVECVLHNLFPGRFVVHTHPTVVNVLTCARRGEAIAEELFGSGVLWAPYVDPGFTLAQSLGRAIGEYAERTGREYPDAVLIQNHGLFVTGETPGEVRDRTDAVLTRIRDYLDACPADPSFGEAAIVPAKRARSLIDAIAPALRGLLGDGDALPVVTFDDSGTVLGFVGGERGEAAAAGGPLTPDQIVYCRSFPLWFDAGDDDAPEALVPRLREAVARHREATGFPPRVVLVKGIGMFAVGRDLAAARTVRAIYADAIDVMAGANRLGGINALTDSQRAFIEHWEAESYRQKVSAGQGPAGRAAGKIAVVTGAAQGFGFEIAQDLVAQGAHVALTDINADGARAAACALAPHHKPGRAIGLAIDVTDAQSVTDAFHEVVRAFGGFDLLVSNAGVLKADSVKTQPERDFDFVTAVNYKGYYLCVRSAAPVLAVQRLARTDYRSDIIQINSKSGLVGSNRNFAYAGSKFGGIGLTQSFALELVSDGTKVNSICPGNFFDGPLWSDPKNGLFVQYLRAGKVPGARTVEEVRAAYEAKVPMGRGCTTADVMRAVYYLMEQQYETGQALPVTGGQVMLA